MSRPPLNYHSPEPKPSFTAFQYVTATINGIVVFFLGWFFTSFVFLIEHGNAPTGGLLRNVVENVGLFGLPAGLAVMQYRRALRIQYEKERRRRGNQAAENRPTTESAAGDAGGMGGR